LERASGRNMKMLIDASKELSRLLRIITRQRDWALNYQSDVLAQEKLALDVFVTTNWKPYIVK
jgi:hypothetical protein